MDFCKPLFPSWNCSILLKLHFNLHLNSISGSSVVIYVYLGEFHDSVHRTRSIVSSAIILGVGCLLLPLIAWLIINQDWQFDIPFIDVVYKPWRLFLVISSLLELLAFIILLFLSESPKFVLGQGNNQQAYEILQNINHVNNGTEFEKFDLIEEPESIENRQRILKCKESRFPLIKSIWIQTAPLFEGPYLYSTVLICLCQFGIMSTSNGFFMFVADIFNKMASNLDSFVEQRMSMCEAINMKPINQTTQELEGAVSLQHFKISTFSWSHSHEFFCNWQICNTQLEIATIRQEFVLECIFSLGSALVSLLVNKLGKFPILCKEYFILMKKNRAIICFWTIFIKCLISHHSNCMWSEWDCMHAGRSTCCSNLCIYK